MSVCVYIYISMSFITFKQRQMWKSHGILSSDQKKSFLVTSQ